MQVVNLKDIVPKVATFKLEETGDVVHSLRPLTNRDEAWVMQNIEGGWAALSDPTKLKDIMRICYRLLVDKSHFTPIEFEDYDEYGDKVKMKIGGVERFMDCIKGFEEGYEVAKALNTTRGINTPSLEDLEKVVQENTDGKK